MDVPARSLPPDHSDAGFYSNARALPTETEMRLYAGAAEDAVGQAMPKLASLLPSCVGDAPGEDACLAAAFDRVARRLFRRPLTDAERGAYNTKVYAPARKQYGVQAGVRALLEGMLQSINFLYWIEVGVPAPEKGAGVRRLNDFEAAARLAAFLWNGIPDDALLDAAAAGRLRSGEQLAAQARAMVRDARAKASFRSFLEQVFGLQLLEIASPSSGVFNETLRTSMQAETSAFIDHVIWEGNGGFPALLTARFTFLDTNLARSVYGMPSPTGGGLQRVSFAPGSARIGLFTQPSYLTAHQSANSVVKRGLFVRENLLCQELPAPPPGEMNPNTDRLKTQPCVGCHVLLDYIGRSLDRFDSVGRDRTADGTTRVDESGKIVNLEAGVDVDLAGPVDLAQRLAASDTVRTCVARQYFRFTFGREDADQDQCAVATLDRIMKESRGDLRELSVALVGLDGFQYFRAENGGGQACR